MKYVDLEDLFEDGWLKSALRKVAATKLPSNITYHKSKFGFFAPEDELFNMIDDIIVSDI
jgi:hypothetical protein